ncbi:MAG: FixH family protein [Pseudomonadota bacterium]
MTSTTNRKQEFVFTGKHMLLSMVCFFGVIITVNFTMAYLATGTWTGLVVKNSYVASQQFNAELKQAKVQSEAGFISELEYSNGTLAFTLKNRDGQRLKLETISAEIGRPAFEQADRKLVFSPVAGDTYEIAVNLAPGIWALKIEGKDQGFSYRRDARLYVSNDGKGRIE